jgi:hypothetical protein
MTKSNAPPVQELIKEINECIGIEDVHFKPYNLNNAN